MPHDADPDEPDERQASAEVVSFPTPAEDRPQRLHKKKRSSKGKGDKAREPLMAETAPPPPEVPAELAAAGIVIPPKPPLPPDDTSDAGMPEDAGDDVVTSVEREGTPAVDPAPVSVSALDTEPDLDDTEIVSRRPSQAAAKVDPPDVDSEPDLDDTEIVRRRPNPDAAAAVPITAPPQLPDAGPRAPVAGPRAPVAAAARPEAPPVPPAIPADDLETVPRVQAAPVVRGDALVLRGVTKSFGETRAVEAIDLTVPAGTFYGLVGPNGAGKTTTLSMIAGLLRPDRGAISVAGVDAASHPLVAKRMMGVLPDRLRIFDRLTGRQLLYYYGVLRGLSPAVVERRTADLARAFHLTDALGRAVSDYSAGMVKKVMLAGALIHSPRLLVLDEPFESVDPVSSAIILEILSTYVAHGGTVILSSHGMELVERVCSRVAVLVAGQVLAEGTIDEVRGELTLEQRFIELAGGLSDVEGLEWLHTFSD